MSIERKKRYVHINEAAQIMNTTAETLIHFGSIDALEIIAPSPSDCEFVTRYRTTFNGTTDETETSAYDSIAYIAINPHDLLYLETKETTNIISTKKLYAIYEPDYSQDFITIRPLDTVELHTNNHGNKEIKLDFCSDYFMLRPYSDDWLNDENDYHDSDTTYEITRADLYIMQYELDRFIKAQAETPETQEPKEQSEPTGAHLAVIGTMLQLLTTGKDNNRENVFKANNNQNSIADAIATFSTAYETHTGLSSTKAKEIFAEANKYLKSKRK